jgi:hypothetical protein
MLERQLVDQRREGIGGERLPRLVAALEEMGHLRVEDLVGDAARLVQDDAAELRVGVELEVLALVEEPPALRVQEDAVGVREAVGLVRELAVAVGRRLGVDRGRVAAGPLAVGEGAHLDRHAQAVARVVAGAAIPRPAEVPRAPFRIGLEAA